MLEPLRHRLRQYCDPLELAGALLLLLIAFPYVQIVPTASYTQPFPLILAGLLFCLQWRLLWRLPFSDRAALVGLAIVGVVMFLLTCIPYTSTQEYKYLLNYLSPLVITVAALRYLERQPEIARRLLQVAILIWVVVAAIQKFRNPTFATALLGQWGEHSMDIIRSGRGVISLAPEPTHHAFHILVLGACLAMIDRTGRSRLLVLLCVADAVVLAASSSAILVLGMAALVWLVLCQPRWILVAAVLGALGWSIGMSIDWFLAEGSRPHALISEVLADPSALMHIDYSLNIRLGGMSSVIIDTLGNAFAPHGMSAQAWEVERELLLKELPWLMDLSLNGPPSGIGLLLFQAGALALPFFWQVFRRMFGVPMGFIERGILLTVPFIFLSQYYISAPSFSLLYACALLRLGSAAPAPQAQAAPLPMAPAAH